jgi:hypothetical protein
MESMSPWSQQTYNSLDLVFLGTESIPKSDPSDEINPLLDFYSDSQNDQCSCALYNYEPTSFSDDMHQYDSLDLGVGYDQFPIIREEDTTYSSEDHSPPSSFVCPAEIPTHADVTWSQKLEEEPDAGMFYEFLIFEELCADMATGDDEGMQRRTSTG